MPQISWTFKPHVPDERVAANKAAALARGLPVVGECPVKPKLAVVGGGPSVRDRLDDLRDFDGEVLAINGAWRYLRDAGVAATFYTVDPVLDVLPLVDGVERAVLGSSVDGAVFDALEGSHVEVVPLGAGEGEVLHGPTSATAVMHMAPMRGHASVSFYGCEGNYGHTSHAYQCNALEVPRVVVDVAGHEYVTAPGFLVQSEWIAACIRAAPDYLENRSGGLLAALVTCPDYDIKAVSRSIYDRLERAA